MTIVLIEKDSFVRLDMFEALVNAFPGSKVVSLERLDQSAEEVTAPRIVILDTPLGEIDGNAMIKTWTQSGARIILTDSHNQTATEPHQSWRKVDRPFTDQMLLDVVLQPD